MKIVFHVHSQYSSDSNLSLEKIAETCRTENIETAILADHNNLATSQTINGVRIIAGEEIKTNQGEIIALFIKNKIKSVLSLLETIQLIKEQGGLVIVPHPLDPLRRSSIRKEALLKIVDQVDIIEIFNARNILGFINKKAAELACRYNKIKIVGSDAHLASEITNTYIEMADFTDAASFLESLRTAKFYTHKAGLLVHLGSYLNRIVEKI
jgi:predicted metal-dependent phosphoesterase TrpH